MSKCDLCGKCLCFGIKVSHSHRRSNRKWKPNVRHAHVVVNGLRKRISACTRCIRSGKLVNIA
ncbi:MAG: 50S ribosomal protein L28 [Oscillospiraceae bacterium]|nr:50S ribosomal protein L28 [Oscillospiraceae bacterium]